MAITVLKNETGSAWPTSGTPTNANSGLLIDGGTADNAISQAGTFNAWSTASRRDTQPANVTSASFVELSSTGPCFQAILQSGVTDGNFADGVMMDYWIQFKLQSAYSESTPTPPSNTIEEIVEVGDFGSGGTADYLFYLRANTRNTKGFAPGIWLSAGGQSSATFNGSLSQGGASTTIPCWPLKYDEWYHLKFWMKTSASASSNDGKVKIWINDVLLFSSTNADAWWSATSKQRWRFLQGLLGFGGITGVRMRYAGPIRVRVVPEADIEAPDQSYWQANTDLNYSLRRHFSAKHTGYGSPWTISGALSAAVPAVGTNYASGGTQPGGSYLEIPLTAGNGVNLDTPDIWDGSTCDPRDSSTGLCHVVFQDIMPATASSITGRVFTANNTDEIINWQIDASGGTFSVNGVEVYTGLSDSIRWKVIVTIGGGRCTVTLQDQTSASFSSTSMRSADYAYQNGYIDGDPIGKARILPVGSSSETVDVGSVSVYARLDAAMVDSYLSADAGATPAYQCLGQRIGQNFNQHADATVPGGYDPIPYTGGFAGIDFAICAALSGAKLSEFITNVVPQISAIRGVRWFLFGGVVNDIPASGSITTMANAWDAAYTIADREVSFIRWAVARGHSVFVTDGWNLADSGSTFNGATNLYRRKIPGMVATIIKAAIADGRFPNGLVSYIPTDWAVDGNATSIDSDGVHPASGYDSYQVRAFHDAYANVGGLPGWNADGSVTRKATGSGLSMIESMIG